MNITISKFAAINAALAHGAARADVLQQAGIEPAAWRAVQMKWLGKFATAARPGGRGDLQQLYLSHYQGFVTRFQLGEEIDFNEGSLRACSEGAERDFALVSATPFAGGEKAVPRRDVTRRASEDAQYKAGRLSGETTAMPVFDAALLGSMLEAPFEMATATASVDGDAAPPSVGQAPPSVGQAPPSVGQAPPSVGQAPPKASVEPVDPLEFTHGVNPMHVAQSAMPFSNESSSAGQAPPKASVEPVDSLESTHGVNPMHVAQSAMPFSSAPSKESAPPFAPPAAPPRPAAAPPRPLVAPPRPPAAPPRPLATPPRPLSASESPLHKPTMNETIGMPALSAEALRGQEGGAKKSALPFQAQPPSAPSKSRSSQRGSGFTMPFRAIPIESSTGDLESGGGVTKLSLEQFAVLTARIGLNPERREELEAAYGLDAEGHAREKEAWGNLISGHPQLSARYARYITAERKRLAR